jgi:hypothetical protein
MTGDPVEKFGIPTEEAEGRQIISALVEALHALKELADAADSIAVYPEGSFGFEDLADALRKAEQALDRFDFGEPT